MPHLFSRLVSIGGLILVCFTLLLLLGFTIIGIAAAVHTLFSYLFA